MSTSPDEFGPLLQLRNARASELEAVADRFVALVEEFEEALGEGLVPSDFAERLTELRYAVEGLVDP